MGNSNDIKVSVNEQERKRDSNDEFLVDFVDGIHVPVSSVPG